MKGKIKWIWGLRRSCGKIVRVKRKVDEGKCGGTGLNNVGWKKVMGKSYLPRNCRKDKLELSARVRDEC